MMFTKGLHYSPYLEKVVIGACLIEKTAFGRLYGIVLPETFYAERHQKIWQMITEMWENNLPVDLETVVYHMMKKGITEPLEKYDDTAYYLTSCTNTVCSTANLEYWGHILRQMYCEREIKTLTLSGTKENNAIAEISRINARINEIMQIKTTDDFKELDSVVIDLYRHMDNVKDKKLSGITTGFKNLDQLTGGLVPGLWILAARPSVGKSAFMGKMAIAAAKYGHKVAIQSLEMDNTQIGARLASLISEVEFWRIYRNRMQDEQQARMLYETLNKNMVDLPIVISDSAAVSINDIKAKATKLKQKNKVDILFIDYLQLLDTDERNRNFNREQEVSKMSRGLKILSKELNIPIVALCQLNRAVEHQSKTDRYPKLHHLRESGSIEQDADGVMFIHRDSMSGLPTNEDGSSTDNEADVIIAKWRNGELGKIKIGFDGIRMKFFEPGEEMNLMQSNPF